MAEPDIVALPVQGQTASSFMCLTKPPNFKGIFAGGNPLARPQSVFFAQIIVFNLISQCFYFLFRPMKQPRFVCNVLGGIVLSYMLTGDPQSIWSIKSFPMYEIILPQMWSIVGMCYFLFLSSVKMDVTIFKRNAANASFIGIISVFSSFLTTFSLAYILPLSGLSRNTPFRAVFCSGMAFSRFPDFVYSFTELNMLTSDIGQLAISVTMFSEFLAWSYMVVLLSFIQMKYTWQALSASVALGAFVLICLRPMVMWIIKKTPEGKAVKEEYVVLILILTLNVALAADFIGVIHVGIVLVGLIIPSETPLGHTLTEKVEFVVVQILLPMFYVVTGLFLNLKEFDFRYVYEISFLVLMGTLSKFVGVVIAAMSCNVKQDHAVMLGFMMNVKGPFDLVGFGRWRGGAQTMEMNQPSYIVFILSQVIVTAVVVPVTDSMYNSYIRMKASTKRNNMRSIQATPENAELRVLCCIRNEETVPGFIAILKATNPTPFRPLSVIIMLINELVGQAAPTIAPYGDKPGKAKSKRINQIVQAFENSLNENMLDKLVQVTTFNVTAPYKSMHEYICKLALDEMVPLILVPFHGTTTQDGNASASLRGLNSQVQAYASCTVGILVDRTLIYSLARPTLSIYNVAVVFIGGADDREALSLGIRMSSHPLVSVTVLRVTFEDLYMGAHNKTESKLDFRMVDEFKLRNAHNNLAMYLEKWAKDAEDAFNGISSLKGKYDLIIVGRQRQVTRSMSDDLMLNWSENPELGLVGDFVGTSEFCGNTTSVLVMQHYEDTRHLPHESNDHEDQFFPVEL